MKKFFEEYGGVTLGICAVLVLIAMVSPVGAKVKNSLTGIVNGFSESLTEGFSGATGGSDSGEDSGGGSKVTQTAISESDSYIGKYADVDGDGTVDGVIFADLAFSNSGEWRDSWGTWSYSASSNLKQYYVSQTTYTDDFGTAEVIAPISEATGNDRFYVMALDDIDSSGHYWYYSASPYIAEYNDNREASDIIQEALESDIENADMATSEDEMDFGTGKEKTTTMIAKWNSSAYGSQNSNDMWGLIQTQVNNCWFVPSRAEWAAFGSAFSITGSNYSSYNLPKGLWTSALWSRLSVWYVLFSEGRITNSILSNGDHYVRLATTF